MNEVKQFLNNTLNDNDVLVLALSGGPDSTVLLHLLLNIDKKIKIICAHVNHKTRVENESEYLFVKNMLNEKNVLLEYYVIDSYKKGHFTEAEGREKRYEFLKKVMEKYHADYLLTAHHADDLIEGIFLKIFRGSSLNGYSGIKRISLMDNMKVLRPLLSVTKKEILKYADENKISYVIDKSNYDNKYLRNKIRHNIISFLSDNIPNYEKRFINFSNTLDEANSLINILIKDKYNIIINNYKVNKELFFKEEELTRKYLLRYYLKEIYGNDIGFIDNNNFRVINNFLNSKKYSYINLPNNKLLYNNDRYFYIVDKYNSESFCIKCDKNTTLPNGYTLKEISEYEEKSNYEIHLNSKDIKLPLYIVNKKDGMKMVLKNSLFNKKVSDILKDAKVDLDKRSSIPILIDSDNTVLWILGVSKSKYDVEKNGKYDIIYKYFKGGNINE